MENNQPLIEAKIRKIIIGSQKDGFQFEVGKFMEKAGFKVHSIVFNDTHYYKFGEVRYEVFIEKGNEILLWKYFTNQPVIIECFV